MTTTSFVDGVSLSAASWFNDVDSAAYSVLSGVAGTNTITATGPANYSYSATRPPVWFVPAATNTAATTINISPSGGSALGAKNVFFNGRACIGGELKSGMPVAALYDGTQFHIIATTDINVLTVDASPDGAADFLETYDASAVGPKKILLHKATACKVVSFTRDPSTASGNQAVTGVGFTPKAIVFLVSKNSSSMTSWGMDDGTSHFSIGDANGSSTDTYGINASEAIFVIETGTINYSGHVGSFDADGFTIAWTKTGAPTAGTLTIYALCFR
jgi:hypothetical protein